MFLPPREKKESGMWRVIYQYFIHAPLTLSRKFPPSIRICHTLNSANGHQLIEMIGEKWLLCNGPFPSRSWLHGTMPSHTTLSKSFPFQNKIWFYMFRFEMDGHLGGCMQQVFLTWGAAEAKQTKMWLFSLFLSREFSKGGGGSNIRRALKFMARHTQHPTSTFQRERERTQKESSEWISPLYSVYRSHQKIIFVAL